MFHRAQGHIISTCVAGAEILYVNTFPITYSTSSSPDRVNDSQCSKIRPHLCMLLCRCICVFVFSCISLHACCIIVTLWGGPGGIEA